MRVARIDKEDEVSSNVSTKIVSVFRGSEEIGVSSCSIRVEVC